MNSERPLRQAGSDEISLVDIAVTFVKRRYVFYMVFAVVTLSGLAYALLADDEYEYVSLIQVAQKDEEPIQPVATTISTLNNRWLPEVEAAYRAEHGEKMQLKLAFSNPENTGLIRFATDAPVAEAKAVKKAHEALVEYVQTYQEELVDQEKSKLEKQMTSTKEILASLQGQSGAGEAVAAVIEKQSQLRAMLDSLKNVEVLVSSRQSTEKVAPKRTLIVGLSVLVGAVLGVLMAFMVDFSASVKKRMASIEQPE